MCRSPAAGKVPQRSSRVSLNTWRRAKSSLENGSASGRPGYGARESRPPTSSTSLRNRSNPSVPSTSSEVSTGKWLIPVTEAETASSGRPMAMARSMQKLPTSWQSPTVLIPVSRHTARVRAVIGFVMLKSHASGQRSSMALPMPTSTGMFLSARLMPPGPTVSPTVWVMPWAAGTSRSTAMERKPPVEMHTMTKSAPSRACRRSVVVTTVACGAHGVVELVGERLHLGQRRRIDVLEHEVHAGQRGRPEEVGHQLRRPLVAPAADDGHLGAHAATVQCRSCSASGVAPRWRWPPSSWAAAACTWSARSPSRRSCRAPSPRSTTPSSST